MQWRFFFSSQWIKVSLCVSKHKLHAHSLPVMYLHRNWVHYIFSFFFFFFSLFLNQRE